MAKNTSLILGDYIENFIDEQVKTGRFSSASEVVRTALRLFEQEEAHKINLVNGLKAGEKSGFVTNFDREQYLNGLTSDRLPYPMVI